MMNLLAFLALALASPWDTPVTPQGIGAVRVGMSIAALKRIGAVEDLLSPEREDDDVYCVTWRFSGHPGLAAMMTGGLVVRIDVDSPAYRTRSGARVGMAAAEVRALLGAGTHVGPIPRSLTLRARGSAYGMLVETDGSRAVRMRVGRWEQLTYEGGCS